MLDLLLGSPGALSRRSANEWTPINPGHRVPRMRTQAGTVVDADLALTYAAVWAATRLLAETTAGLPLNVYERDGSDRHLAADLPLYDLVHTQANEKIGSGVFREGRTMHQVNWGNGFAEIERNGNNDPIAMHPIHPSRLYPATADKKALGFAYDVRNNDGSLVSMRASEILHVPGTLSEDGIWGKGVIQHARESIGFGIATERHGSTYFGTGAQPKGVLTAPHLSDREKRADFREEWKLVHGSPDSNEIAILPVNSKFTPITISNEDSQFLQTRKHNDIVIAQWYRVPPHMLGNLDKATFSNIEHQQLEFVIYSLFPWVKRWEEQANLKLLSREQRRTYFIEHNFEGLLRGDIKTRMDAYQTALQNGILTINEVRRLENRNGIGPAGDQHYVQLNMTTAERMLQEPDAARISSTQVAVPGRIGVSDVRALIEGPVASGAEPTTDDRSRVRPIMHETLSRMFRKEANAVRRAIGKTSIDFTAWLSEFHAKHRGTIAEALGPVVSAFPGAMLSEDISTPQQIAALCAATSATVLNVAFNTDTPEQMANRLDAWDTDMATLITSQALGDNEHDERKHDSTA